MLALFVTFRYQLVLWLRRLTCLFYGTVVMAIFGVPGLHFLLLQLTITRQ